ncbi:hypothetical protein EIP91_006602 [Steccherinum ochraceum]|uniref:NAD(P)-binding protein n=1 Tax=Steccherinum ochraceum TaxID=92696 RepID=A0A4R0RDU5_9APHY|nr:hypothetical protein EIP91_006602 [Steccherinum ochraceum]
MSKPIAEYTPQVAIVTGAAKGIGRAIALRLASDGFKVVVNDRLAQEDALNALAVEIPSLGRDATEATASEEVRTLVVTGDVSVEADVDKLIRETVKVFGGVDAVIANAGIALGGVFLEYSMNDLDQVLAVNVRGVMLCFQRAARQMVKQKRGGRLIAASSMYGQRGVAYNQAYCASKFAVRGLCQSIARELMPYKITCNSYAPGCILTDMTDRPEDKMLDGQHGSFIKALIAGTHEGPDAGPDVVASMVSYLCKPEAYFVTGECMSMSGGLIIG